MKYYLLLILFVLTTNCDAQWYKKRYEKLLEPNSKLILAEYNYSVEKINDTLYLYKRYFTGNMQITDYMSFYGKKLIVKNGLFQKMYDDGTVVSKGYYYNNEKEGHWLEERENYGWYKKGKKIGKWKTMDLDSTITSERNYVNDALHGKKINFDSLGNIASEEIYAKGELISSTGIDTLLKVVEEMPRFPGCENEKLPSEELFNCSKNKLLTFIYSKLKYPSQAREYGVEGMALFKFVIDKDGNVGDIKTLYGLSGDIKKECLRLINEMPKWRPGYVDGEPVKVEYTLPIRFKLQ